MTIKTKRQLEDRIKQDFQKYFLDFPEIFPLDYKGGILPQSIDNTIRIARVYCDRCEYTVLQEVEDDTDLLDYVLWCLDELARLIIYHYINLPKKLLFAELRVDQKMQVIDQMITLSTTHQFSTWRELGIWLNSGGQPDQHFTYWLIEGKITVRGVHTV